MSQKYLQRFCQGAFKWNLGFDESALVLPEIVLVPESQYFESGTLSGIDSIGCGECTAAECASVVALERKRTVGYEMAARQCCARQIPERG